MRRGTLAENRTEHLPNRNLESCLRSNPPAETVLNEVWHDKKTLPQVTLRNCNMWHTSLGMMGAKRLSHRDASKATRLSVCPTSE